MLAKHKVGSSTLLTRSIISKATNPSSHCKFVKGRLLSLPPGIRFSLVMLVIIMGVLLFNFMVVMMGFIIQVEDYLPVFMDDVMSG